MQFKRYFAVFLISFYLSLLSRNGHFVVSQYPNDYFEFENSINNDVNPYYAPRARQYEEPDQINNEVATATLLVGGAALLGAIGIVGIAGLQGLNNFKDAKYNKSTCCDRLEIKLQELERKFDDEEDEQDILEARQRALCNLADDLHDINIVGNLQNAGGGQGNQQPNAAEFNALVAVVRQILDSVNGLPMACSNGVK